MTQLNGTAAESPRPKSAGKVAREKRRAEARRQKAWSDMPGASGEKLDQLRATVASATRTLDPEGRSHPYDDGRVRPYGYVRRTVGSVEESA
jgi:hypothetical protein